LEREFQRSGEEFEEYKMEKVYKMSDVLKALEDEKKLRKYVKEALARGGRSLVIDANIMKINSYLEDKNYTTSIARGLDDQIKREQLRSKVFITNDNNQHQFSNPLDLQKYIYGLIITPNLNEIDEKVLADLVEKVLMQANFANSLLQIWRIHRDSKIEKRLEIEND